MSKSRKRGILTKAIVALLLAPFLLIGTAIILLYIPPIQEYATGKVCDIVSCNSDFTMSIERFSLNFPIKIRVRNIELSHKESKIVDGEKIEISISPLALLKGEIELNYLSVENTSVESNSLIDDINLSAYIGNFRATARNIAIAKEKADIRMLHLSDSRANITIATKLEEDSTENSTDWILNLRRGTIENLAVTLNMPDDTISLAGNIGKLAVYDVAIDIGSPRYSLQKATLMNSNIAYNKGRETTESPINHIRLENINIGTGLLLYSEPLTKVEITNMSLQQEEYMSITNSALIATIEQESVNIQEFSLQTANGSYAQMSAFFPLTIEDSTETVSSNIELHIDKRDLCGLLCSNDYSKLQQLPDSMLTAAAIIGGNQQMLCIDSIKAEIPSVARLCAGGKIENILRPQDIAANIYIKGAIENISPIINAQSDSIAPRRAIVCGAIDIQGTALNADITIESDSSNMHAVAAYDTKEQEFSAKATIENLHLDRTLPGIPLYTATLKIDAEGKGTDILDPSTHYNCNITIDTIHYDKIQLSAVELNAQQSNALSHIALNSVSPNLLLNIDADTHIDSTNIKSSAKIELAKADLKSLGVVDAPLDASFTLNIQCKSNMQERHSLRLQGEQFKLKTTDRTYTPAALNLIAETQPDTSYINISTGDLKIDASLAGGYKRLMSALDTIAAMYDGAHNPQERIFNVQEYKKLLPGSAIEIECGQKNIIANYLLFNGIKFNNFSLSCKMDSTRGINATAGLYALQKEDFILDTIRVSTRQSGNAINYFAGVRSSAINPEREKLKFYASLFGTMNDNKLKSNFLFRDNQDHTGAKIGLTTLFMPDKLQFSFDSEAILLDHPFSFNRNNFLTVEKDAIINGDIEFTDSENRGLRLYASHDSIQMQQISLELLNINLQAVTGTVPFAPSIGGTLNGNIHYSKSKKEELLYGAINGTGISYENTTIGDENISFAYRPIEAKRHSIELSMRHYGSKILSLYGEYRDGTLPHIDGNITLAHFPLKISNAFLSASGATVDGYIDGELSLNGSTKQLNSNGYIRFDSVSTDIPALGTRLHLVNDKVDIKDNRLNFNNFNIYAKGTTPFKINGNVNFTRLTNPEFDLRMRADNYELVNAARKKGAMLYGRLFIDINAFIRGTLDAMSINGNTTLLGKSNITYVMYDTPLSATNELDGLVEFVNFSDTTKIVQEQESFNLGNSTMNLNLTIEDGARINADFDEGRNSYIELQGGGNLNLTYTSEAGMSLTGRYTLSNGQMKYSLPIIPLKTFSINNGSYIYWTGDITNPTLNITALERVTAPVTLEEGHTQAVAFDVGVVLTNTLDNMGLNFTLSAPENAAVQNELNSIDKETLNKYAAAMLITGTYIGNSGGVSVSSALSSFIDAKINDLAGSAIKSVNINVGITDVENSESGGTYKNYSFSFSKRFWNDRLTVVIGGEVNSGDTPANADNNSFINNVSLEWKISESGNRYLRLFYDKNYESILEGEITEAGVGYIYKRKMENLKELFTFKRKKARNRNSK